MYRLTRGGEKDEDLESLQRVFDLLPDRITEVRDMQLALLDPAGTQSSWGEISAGKPRCFGGGCVYRRTGPYGGYKTGQSYV